MLGIEIPAMLFFCSELMSTPMHFDDKTPDMMIEFVFVFTYSSSFEAFDSITVFQLWQQKKQQEHLTHGRGTSSTCGTFSTTRSTFSTCCTRNTIARCHPHKCGLCSIAHTSTTIFSIINVFIEKWTTSCWESIARIGIIIVS